MQRVYAAVILNENNKLVAADSSDYIVLAESLAHFLTEFNKHFVAENVAERVIDLLKVVKVKHYKRVLCVFGRRHKKLVNQRFDCALVEQHCERVLLRFFKQPDFVAFCFIDVAAVNNAPQSICRRVQENAAVYFKPERIFAGLV